MPATLKISDDLNLPLDAVTQKFGILGTSGSGKSYCAMKLAELMLAAGAQTISVDPVGIWWSLRLKADGKHEAFSQVRVFGGDHGDLPLTPESGALIGRLLAERRISAVLDVSQFLTGEMKRFLTEFAEQFFQSKKSHKSPVHLFLEECQAYIPEAVVDKDDGKMVNRWERLIKFYRNYGGGTSMISQQPQSVSKKVLNLADTLFAMRTIGSHERKAIEKWVKDVIETESDLVKNLPKLPTGTAHIWSPSWLGISRDVKILPKTTFDAGKTPEMGMKMVEPKPLTPIDVEKLREEMSEIVEKVKADDPVELRKRIRDLERQKNVAPVPAPSSGKVEKIDREALFEAQRIELSNLVRNVIRPKFEKALGEGMLVGLLGRLREAADKIESVIAGIKDEKQWGELQYVTAEFKKNAKAAISIAPDRIEKVEPERVVNSGMRDKNLPPGERAVLIAAVQFDGVEKEQLIVLTGYATRSRDAYIQRLASKNYVVLDGRTVRATDAGKDALGGAYSPLPVGDALWQYWQKELPEGELKLLRVLVESGKDRKIPKQALMDATGYAQRSVDAYLQRLGKKRLVDVGRGEAKASSNLFD